MTVPASGGAARGIGRMFYEICGVIILLAGVLIKLGRGQSMTSMSYWSRPVRPPMPLLAKAAAFLFYGDLLAVLLYFFIMHHGYFSAACFAPIIAGGVIFNEGKRKRFLGIFTYGPPPPG